MSSQKCTILIAGSNSGIRYDLVKLLASKGHIVYLAVKNEAARKEAQYIVLKGFSSYNIIPLFSGKS